MCQINFSKSDAVSHITPTSMDIVLGCKDNVAEVNKVLSVYSLIKVILRLYLCRCKFTVNPFLDKF